MEKNRKQFDNEKRQCLGKIDRSIKGSIDEPIELLVDYINSLDDYYTTSSCSGRIIVVSEPDDEEENHGKSVRWQYVSHERMISADPIIERLKQEESSMMKNVTFKFEPFIMHIRCRTMDSAKCLLHIATGSGLRNSGIMISNRGHWTVAVRGTINLESPIFVDGRWAADDCYIRTLVTVADKKMSANQTLIERFTTNIMTDKDFHHSEDG